MAILPIRALFSRTQWRAGALCLVMVGAAATAGAGGVDDLLNQKDLTPDTLARRFARFSFEQTDEVQEPETFLQHKRGDCADYSNLASTVLSHHGYTTKMVVIMMERQTHVVCYVKEVGGFLDYNHRADAHPIIPSDGSLEDIAGKVARDFRSEWRMASFFRYRGVNPVYLDSVFAGETSAAKSEKHERRHKAKAREQAPQSHPVAVQAVIN